MFHSKRHCAGQMENSAAILDINEAFPVISADAISDANKAIEIDPTISKAYLRKG
jgi:hypothetical protein